MSSMMLNTTKEPHTKFYHPTVGEVGRRTVGKMLVEDASSLLTHLIPFLSNSQETNYNECGLLIHITNLLLISRILSQFCHMSSPHFIHCTDLFKVEYSKVDDLCCRQLFERISILVQLLLKTKT